MNVGVRARGEAWANSGLSTSDWHNDIERIRAVNMLCLRLLELNRITHTSSMFVSTVVWWGAAFPLIFGLDCLLEVTVSLLKPL